jgi:hypothetical protein
VKLLSQEMLDEMVKRSENPDIQETLKGLTIRLIMVATDCPGDEDRGCRLLIEDGKIVKAETEAKPAPSAMRDEALDKAQFDAKVVSPFEPLTDLVTEKMSLVAAFGYVKIDGDLPKLMTQVEGFVAFLKFIGSLPVEWGT